MIPLSITNLSSPVAIPQRIIPYFPLPIFGKAVSPPPSRCYQKTSTSLHIGSILALLLPLRKSQIMIGHRRI